MAGKTKTDSVTGKGTNVPDSIQDMWHEHRALTTRVNMLQWVVGFVFGVFLILAGFIAQISVNNINVNNALRTDHNALRIEFEVYKAQNPPIAKVPPKDSQTPIVVPIPPKNQ